MRTYIEWNDLPSLTVPARVVCFGTVLHQKTKRGKPKPTPCGWDAWNRDPRMEQRMARLQGAGSFYWPCAYLALRAAKQMMQDDARIDQIKVETISAREIARIYR